jgi:hypothetical protein
MVLFGMASLRLFVAVVVALMLSSAIASASIPEPIDQTSIAPAQLSWFDTDGSTVQRKNADPNSGQKSTLTVLAVKFSKYDMLFRNVFDNAHSALDGYQMKYKITF